MVGIPPNRLALGSNRSIDRSQGGASENWCERVDVLDRFTGIYWDLDNIQGTGPPEAALIVAHRVRKAVAPHIGELMEFKVYGNEVTWRKHAPSLGLWDIVGAEPVQLGKRSQAVDVAMLSDAYFFARTYMGESCVACISDDKGNEGILRYLTSIGVFTITVGTFLDTRLRDGVRKDVAKRLESMELAAASRCAVIWDRELQVQLNEEEEELWERIVGRTENSRARVLTGMKDVKGAVRMVWYNPKQN